MIKMIMIMTLLASPIMVAGLLWPADAPPLPPRPAWSTCILHAPEPNLMNTVISDEDQKIIDDTKAEIDFDATCAEIDALFLKKWRDHHYGEADE